MVIENVKTAMHIWIRNLISTILLSAIAIILFMTPLLDEPILGIGPVEIILLFIAIYLYLVLKPIILKYQFIYMSHEDNKISIKFYTIGFIPGSRKSFEFPANEFYKFELYKSFFNLRENIVLYRKLKKGIAKYPPITLSGLKEKQRNQLITLFTSLSKVTG